jgi:hypothetical protein
MTKRKAKPKRKAAPKNKRVLANTVTGLALREPATWNVTFVGKHVTLITTVYATNRTDAIDEAQQEIKDSYGWDTDKFDFFVETEQLDGDGTDDDYDEEEDYETWRSQSSLPFRKR